MKNSIRLFVILCLLPSAFVARAQQSGPVIAKVNKAMTAADAKQVALYFHDTIDLEAGNTDGNYSKDQAEVILHDFFSKNPVRSYTVKHQGASDDGSKYIIGSYVTASKNYRVYILFKQADGGLKINQLQFEED